MIYAFSPCIYVIAAKSCMGRAGIARLVKHRAQAPILFLISYMPAIDRFIVVILAAGGNPARKPRIAPEMTLRVSVTSWIPAFARMTASRDM